MAQLALLFALVGACALPSIVYRNHINSRLKGAAWIYWAALAIAVPAELTVGVQSFVELRYGSGAARGLCGAIWPVVWPEYCTRAADGATLALLLVLVLGLGTLVTIAYRRLLAGVWRLVQRRDRLGADDLTGEVSRDVAGDPRSEDALATTPPRSSTHDRNAEGGAPSDADAASSSSANLKERS